MNEDDADTLMELLWRIRRANAQDSELRKEKIDALVTLVVVTLKEIVLRKESECLQSSQFLPSPSLSRDSAPASW